jgi:Predicted membrane protein
MIISCVVSFILNRSWTFQVRGKTEARQIIKYIVSQILNICVNVAVNTEIYSIFQNKPAAYLAATSAGMTVNFLLQRFFVFTRAEGEEN